MIKAVIIDDERLAIREMNHHLKNYSDIEVVNTFIDPIEGIEYIKANKPDILFLDINMPGINGIKVAEELLDLDHRIRIIFVTAYDEYALEAFEVYAFDYIVKPIDAKRLDKTIMRILGDFKFDEKPKQKDIYIRSFGGFELGFVEGECLKWRTSKTKELIAFLIHNRNRRLNKEVIVDRLWPELTPDKAKKQLYNGIYYIRKTLLDYGIARENIAIGSDYGIKLSGVLFDVELLKKEFESKEPDVYKLKELYKGDYMAHCNWEWATPEQESLKNKYVHHMLDGIERMTELDNLHEIEELLLYLYRQEPYEEKISVMLVETYVMQGNKNKAFNHYDVYARLIDEELGILPEDSFQDRLKNL